MKRSKKYLALLLAATLISPSAQFMSRKAEATYNTNKLSSDLVQVMSTASKNEELPVVIWTSDINYESVDYQAEKNY